MSKFGLSGVFGHPASTIPAVLVGLGGVASALGWCDAITWERWAAIIGPGLIAIIGALYKGPQ